METAEHVTDVTSTPQLAGSGLPPGMGPDGATAMFRRPFLWLGDTSRPDPERVEGAYPKLAEMVFNAVKRKKDMWRRTYVGWVTGDPSDWPTTATTHMPPGPVPLDRTALMLVNVARNGRRGRLPEVWTVLVPLCVGPDGLASRLEFGPDGTAECLTYARTLITGDDALSANSPPLFSSDDSACLLWAQAAMTALRILCDVHVNSLEVALPVPDYYCRVRVTDLRTGRVSDGWGERNTLVAAGNDDAEVFLNFPYRGRDRLLWEDPSLYQRTPGVWVDVPEAGPWGVIDAPLADHQGHALSIQIPCGTSTISVEPRRV